MSVVVIVVVQQPIKQWKSLVACSIGCRRWLTNAYLLLSGCLKRLAELKPILSCPDTIELPTNKKLMDASGALGRLDERCAAGSFANLYIGQLKADKQLQLYKCVMITQLQMNLGYFSYPSWGKLCPGLPTAINPQVQPYILAFGSTVKLRWRRQNYNKAIWQQLCYKPQLKLRCKWEIRRCNGGYKQSATRLQSGEQLSEADRKKTRIVSKLCARELTFLGGFNLFFLFDLISYFYDKE